MLSETGMPVDEYLRLLKEQVTEIMAEGKSLDYPYSMTAAWKLSVSDAQGTTSARRSTCSASSRSSGRSPSRAACSAVA